MDNEIINEVVETADTYVEGDNIYYTSGDVAGMVGLSRDMVRYYTKEFEEFIKPEKTSGGHLRYSGEDIEVLRLIISLLKKHTPAEIKILMRDNDVKMVYNNVGDEYHGLLKLLLENNKYLADLLAESIGDKIIKPQMMLLEQNDGRYNELVTEISELKKENQELKDILLNLIDKIDDASKKRSFWNRFKK